MEIFRIKKVRDEHALARNSARVDQGLPSLERYERRAFSKRKRALRELESIEGLRNYGTAPEDCSPLILAERTQRTQSASGSQMLAISTCSRPS